METINTNYNFYKQEYSSLRRHGLLVGACLLCNFLLQNVFVLLLRLFGLVDAYYGNASFQYAVSAVFVTAGCLGVPFFIMSCRKGSLSYRRALPFNFPEDKSKAFYLICAGFAFCLASNYLAVFFNAFLNGIGVGTVENEVVNSVSVGDTFLNFLCAAVVAPLIEEFVFRGVIMQPLRRFGNVFAVVASALLFGLSHGGPSNIVFAFLCGVALGFVVIASKSIWVGIAVHFLNNFYAVASYELYNAFPSLGTLPQLIMGVVIFALGAGAVAALLIRRELRLPRVNTTLSNGKRIRAFFINIPMLLVLAYLVVGMLTYIE